MLTGWPSRYAGVSRFKCRFNRVLARMRFGLHIERDIDDRPVADAQGKFLFAERHQQILRQPPVQKRAGLRMHADDLHIAELADHRVRLFGGGHEPILGIAIDKHVELLLGREISGM